MLRKKIRCPQRKGDSLQRHWGMNNCPSGLKLGVQALAGSFVPLELNLRKESSKGLLENSDSQVPKETVTHEVSRAINMHYSQVPQTNLMQFDGPFIRRHWDSGLEYSTQEFSLSLELSYTEDQLRTAWSETITVFLLTVQLAFSCLSSSSGPSVTHAPHSGKLKASSAGFSMECGTHQQCTCSPYHPSPNFQGPVLRLAETLVCPEFPK